MELLDYIKYLLIENDYVILPGLGGFITHYKSTEIHEGNFMPPCKSFLFDKNLNYNDNRLTNYIINKEGISRTEASNKVNRAVKNIIYRLGEGDKIEIPDIGILQYDIKGTLYFKEQVNKNFNISNFGMPSFRFETFTHKEKEIKKIRNKYWFCKKSYNKNKIPVKENKDNTAKKNTPEIEATIENETNHIKTSVQKVIPIQKEENISTKDPVLNKKNIPIKKSIPMSDPIQKKEKNLKNEISSVEKSVGEQKIVEEKNTPPAKKQVQKKETDSKGMMILKIILVLAVTIVIAMIINKELDKKHDNKVPVKENISVPAQPMDSLTNTEETEKQIVVKKDTVTNISENSNSQKVFKNPETVSPSNGSYFIIGGVFESQSHAVKYMDKMKAKGYTNIQDITFSKDLHYISIDRFSTLNDAKAAKKKILTEDPKSGVWIYKKH